MSDFKKQIDEDLKDYVSQYPNIKDIDDPAWAFNFWVLDKLFSIDEELIESHIVDRHDYGTDCFVWHEDSHDLYLIQNKYLTEHTTISKNYVMNEFIPGVIGSLENGTYTKSAELQNIYNKYSDADDFYVYFYLYATNNKSKTSEIENAIAEYNEKNKNNNKEAKFFSLDDIEETYFQPPTTNKKKFKYTINSPYKRTILNIDNIAYGTNLVVDAKYVLTPILTIYDLYNSAKKEGYSLFSDNIREYLGSAGSVNKKIKATLNNPEDRNNFFFYNNGITMIVHDIGSEETDKGRRVFDVINPQIVNGCQTVSTIWETLSALPENSLERDFKNVYIMTKILKIPVDSDDEKYKELYDNIVKYNNSQNSIPVKSFTANEDEFNLIKREFASKGFLVCIKQSDKYSYTEEYVKPTKLKDRNSKLLSRFGLEDLNKTRDFIVDLDKLLQIFTAFINTPDIAAQKKASMLKQGTPQYESVIEFIKNPDVTIDTMVLLFLLYLKVEKGHKKGEKNPVSPYYIVYCFSVYECNRNVEEISKLLSTKEQVDQIYNRYTKVASKYLRRWNKNNDNLGYNAMVKSPVDKDLLDEIVEDVKEDETYDE